jgi:leucyl aminopeptidase
MQVKIDFAAPKMPKSGAVAVGVVEGGKLLPSAASLDQASGGTLTRAIKQAGRFSGKKGQMLELVAPGGLGLSRVVLIGMGKPKDLKDLDFENGGGSLFARLAGTGETGVTLMVDGEGFALSLADRAARMALGACLRSYRFDKYKTKEKPDDKPSLKSFTVMVENPAAAKRAYAAMEQVAEGVVFTRNLVSEPANIIYPKSLVSEAKKLGKLGVTVQVLGVREMAKLGMGALLGVGQGSVQESQLLVMRWNGAGGAKSGASKGGASKGGPKGPAPVAFVGKGVTFDTGGISIKPAANMEDMKWDMGGAGVVIGLMRALAGRKAKVNAVGVCGLVENMPSGTAQRPGDIVTSMSGQTIEVINTDAEGRLVLADALWYTQENFKPRAIVDLATLTGAIIIALGSEHAGLFCNDDKMSAQLTEAGKSVDEPVWRMPLAPQGESYDKAIDSDAADMKNVGNRSGGSITAAQFLQRFVQKGTPWAHLDIAGTTWSSKDKPTVPKGGTGFGVRLLDRWVADNYEK